MYNTDMPTRADLPTPKQLLRSTVIAAAIATVLLVTVILPSEYGIDPTGAGRALGLTKMGEIKQQLAADNALQEVTPAPAIVPAEAAVQPVALAEDASRDEITIVLAPNQGAEVKVRMRRDAEVDFSWEAVGGGVNHDTHGDGEGVSHSYSKGRGVERDAGRLIAKFDGKHGWFWRNRNDRPVTIVLKSSGDYTEFKRVL